MSEAAAARRRDVRCLSAGGFHRMSYLEWGLPDAGRAALCVHGLTRTAADFEVLAEALAGDGWRVVAPDVVGRGASGRLADPLGYGQPQYLADMTVLLARLGAERVDWIGTSMGGLIGLLLAALDDSPVERLVLNDVGPFIPKAALERIVAYVGTDPHFSDMAAAEAYIREVHAPFGRLDAAQWRRLTEISVVPDDGGYRLHYDPRIVEPLRQLPLEPVDLWAQWDRIRCPVLVLRGAESDLLLPETAAEMAARGPRARIVEFPDCGHAPALRDPRQIGTVRDWLQETV